jgi:hypothetical protein
MAPNPTAPLANSLIESTSWSASPNAGATRNTQHQGVTLGRENLHTAWYDALRDSCARPKSNARNPHNRLPGITRKIRDDGLQYFNAFSDYVTF